MPDNFITTEYRTYFFLLFQLHAYADVNIWSHLDRSPVYTFRPETREWKSSVMGNDR